MKIYKDTLAVLLPIVAAGQRGITLKEVEVASALGDVSPGPDFNECIRQLVDLGLINICDGIVTVWCVKAGGIKS